MSVPICACGHPWASHLSRFHLADYVAQVRAQGGTQCSYCFCPDYVDAVDVENRGAFRVTQKVRVGNVGALHPLMLALSRLDSESVHWADLACKDCGAELELDRALLLDSGFYCGPCFLKHPEVYVG